MKKSPRVNSSSNCPLGTELRPPIHFTQLTKQPLDGCDALSWATQAIHNRNFVVKGFKVHLPIPRMQRLVGLVMCYEVSQHHKVSFKTVYGVCLCLSVCCFFCFLRTLSKMPSKLWERVSLPYCDDLKYDRILWFKAGFLFSSSYFSLSSFVFYFISKWNVRDVLVLI